ncbi:MAG: hypothetical protein ACFFCM_18420, partial [Promethearchaeota archaeon]
MKELTWVNPLIGTTDYVESEEDEIIRDVASRLLWKYNDRILEVLNLGYGNVRNVGINMLTIKLYYIIQGRKVPISLRNTIGEIAQDTDKIYWIPEPIGGMKIGTELFKTHLKEIVGMNGSEWKYIDNKRPEKGIYVSSKWRDGVVRVSKILFNAEYPDMPPTIQVTPRPKDPCFDSEGFLHFAQRREKRTHLVWDRYKSHVNPLIYLIDELYDKYGIDLFFDLKV